MIDRADSPRADWAFAEHEHRELARGLAHLHEVACAIDAWVKPDLASRLLSVLDWLAREFEPHVAWEEAWLYPEIDARIGTPWATRFARFDHQQIHDMAARVQTDRERLHEDAGRMLLAEIRCHLFGLEALLRAHLEREERFLIPSLADDRAIAPAARAHQAPGTG